MSADADALVVASLRAWVARDFEPACARAGIGLIHSLGLDVPDLSGLSAPAWWTPLEHAARLRHAGVDLPLLAPGPHFVAGLPRHVLGRSVWSGSLAELASSLQAGQAPPGCPSTDCWVKPAEMKVEAYPATRFADLTHALALAADVGLPPDSVLQVSAQLPPLAVEFRCFVADGRVLGSSPYLEHDGHSTRTWHEQMHRDGEQTADVEAFAQQVLDDLGEQAPPAMTLDVAVTTAGAVLVLEANPVWSSAVYGTDIDAALHCVLRAADHHGRHPQWRWQPDAYLEGRACRMRVLPVRGATG